MTLNELRSKVEGVLFTVRDGLTYDEDKTGMRSRMLTAFADLLSLLSEMREEAREKAAPAGRFCLAVPPSQVWVSTEDSPRYVGDNGSYVTVPERNVYFIDGYVTESKILAIKQVRTLDGCGLREAKDLVDGLQQRAVFPSKM